MSAMAQVLSYSAAFATARIRAAVSGRDRRSAWPQSWTNV
jgi:hypothetical protein